MGNQKGFSLVGVLVGLAMAGMLSMLLADMGVLMIKTNQTAQGNADILGYVNQLRTNLQTPGGATAMLIGQSLTGPVKMKDPVVAGSIIAEAGYKQQPNDVWQVQTVSFTNVQPGSSANLYRMTIEMNFLKDAKRIIGSAYSRRIIGDVYCFATGNVITSCTGGTDPVADAKIQCKALGYGWNDQGAFGSQCAFAKIDPPKQPEMDKPNDDNQGRHPDSRHYYHSHSRNEDADDDARGGCGSH